VYYSMRRALALALLMLMMTITPMPASAQGTGNSIVINEILVSVNNANYGGTDWNGDGSMGSYSDQYVELYNPTSEAIDIGGWYLDDIADGGSPACSIKWNTILEPGGYITFFRSWTQIEFDYWDGDTIRILDGNMNEIDAVSYQGEDSDWDIPYGYDSTGNWTKLSDGAPTPGGLNDQEWVGVANVVQGNCYPPQDHIHRGEYILEGRVVTMESQDSVIDDGRILVIDGMIEAVWSASESTPSAAEGVVSIPTSGTIYPGFIDPHNHAKYNIIPLWDHGTDGWDNRYQWQAEDSYRDAKEVGCSLTDPTAQRFAELRAIAGGNTALQGSSTSYTDTFETMLARNIELYNFGKDYIHTKVSELSSDYQGNHIKDGNASGELDAWFLHLAEGIDESSRAEFDILVQNDLLVGELVVIHGTGLTQAEFDALGNVGGSLAWSPTSNLILYGETTDIATAKAEGVNIMIGPDWAPSGSKSSMHELKTADWWDQNVLGDIFTDYELVQTITTNIVDAIGWADFTGRIQPGLAADLVVLDTFHADPYRNVVEAIDPDVRLVVVGGLAVFGDVDIMQAMDDEIQIIQGDGFTKAADITYDGVPEATQTVDELMAFLANCNQGAQVPLEYLFTLGDERYFDVLNRSQTFQNGRSIDLWSEYYDIDLDEDGHRVGGTVGGADPINTTIEPNNGGNGNNGGSTVPEPDLPNVFATYGPRGATLSHPTTIEEGIHLESCSSDNGQTTPEDKELLCGSILVVMQSTDDCIELEGWYCQLEVGDAFAVPSKLCEDTGSLPTDVTCRDAWSYLDIEEEPEPEPEPDLPENEEDPLLEGPLYWVAVISLIGLLVASIVTINQNLRGSDEDE